jgi:hypothetical protein
LSQDDKNWMRDLELSGRVRALDVIDRVLNLASSEAVRSDGFGSSGMVGTGIHGTAKFEGAKDIEGASLVLTVVEQRRAEQRFIFPKVPMGTLNDAPMGTQHRVPGPEVPRKTEGEPLDDAKQ